MADTILPPFLDQAPKKSPSLTVREVLALPAFARARVVAGEAGLDRRVLWSHVVEIPDPAPWVPEGYFLLTTGLSWPQGPSGRAALIEALAAGNVAGVALAVPGYLGAFDAESRAAADRAFLPLIEIPFEVPFAWITEQLHRAIVAEPYRLVERSMHIHQALMRAASQEASLEDLARTLSPLIGRSVTFEDPSGRLLAHCSIDERIDSVRQETLQHAQTPEPMLQALKTMGLDRRLRTSEKPVRVPALPEIGLNARVACPIRLGSEFVGAVWIIEGGEPLSEFDHHAAEVAALVAAIHIAHQRELAALEASLGYASVLSLLESEIDPAPAALERVALLGFDARESYRAVIALLPDDLPSDREGLARRDRVAECIGNALKATGGSALLSVALNRVPFLLPAATGVREFVSSIAEPGLAIVAGRAYEGVAGVRRSYRQALSLARYRDRRQVCEFDDVLVPRVLAGDEEARRTFVDGFVAPLMKQRGGKSLVEAVVHLARNGFAMKETAAQLGIHANTLRYRLTRASETLALPLDDANVRFELQLVARLLETGL